MARNKSIRTILTEILDQRVESIEASLEKAKQARELAKKFNPRKATYLVGLDSAWANEGERSTKTTYRGTLEAAIKAAETEFKATNKRSDVQATYSVQVQFGDSQVSIPKEYWEQFKEKH